MPEDANKDFIVSELLSELKEESARKTKTIHMLIAMVCACVLAIIMVVGFFISYLRNMEFETTETITTTTTANGVYALVDSQGNVIAQDLAPEDIAEIVANGQGPESNAPGEGS